MPRTKTQRHRKTQRRRKIQRRRTGTRKHRGGAPNLGKELLKLFQDPDQIVTRTIAAQLTPLEVVTFLKCHPDLWKHRESILEGLYELNIISVGTVADIRKGGILIKYAPALCKNLQIKFDPMTKTIAEKIAHWAAFTNNRALLQAMEPLANRTGLRLRWFQDKILESAGRGGHKGLIVDVLNRPGNAGRIKAYAARALKGAALGGHFPLVQWLIETYGLDKTAIVDGHDCNRAFTAACAGGNLPMIEWLIHKYVITNEEFRYCKGKAFNMACAAGHLRVAKFLADRYRMTKADVMMGRITPFEQACSKGYLEMAQWLAFAFALTPADVYHRYAVIWLTCANGHVDVLQWLYDTFGKFPIVECYKRAIRENKLNVLKWIAETYKMTRGEVKENIGVLAEEYGRRDIIDWIQGLPRR